MHTSTQAHKSTKKHIINLQDLSKAKQIYYKAYYMSKNNWRVPVYQASSTWDTITRAIELYESDTRI